MPLSGIKVLDLTSVVVGPAATLRLADHGAEIIKIEAPEGDLMRTLGGPSPSGTLSGKFLHFNRDKRFVCLNLRVPEGLKALRSIMQGCDVFISNLRPDALARLGLDAAACRALKPELIHCIITGFGPGGPYRGRPAYDTVLQAASGLAGLTIERDGKPSFAPFLAADHVVAEIAAGAIAAALVRMFRSGDGATIEVPMHETMAAFVLQEHLGPATFDPPLGPPGDRRVLDPFARPVATKDGWIAITANTDAQAKAFLRAVGRAELIDDPRFASVAARVKNSNDWYRLREETLAQGTTAHWLETFAAIDIPAMPCHALGGIADDPHLSAVRLVEHAVHPTEGPVRNVRPTLIFDDAPVCSETPALPMGSDTRKVLAEAGYSDTEIDDLVRSGAAVEAAGT
ncbi:MAG TPA: CoA transferase [Xanthobacteraceae bacterium]|nr:CoA transferase [Xanthobacteraceae bacterium]